MLYRWADLIEEHADELALIETRDMGMAIGDARWCAGNAAAVMRYYAGAVDKFFGSTIPVDRDGIVLTFREPIGVTALITPWNFPLNIGNWKTAPAIAAGNTVVLKPASLSPLSALRYAELGLEAGLPARRAQRRPGPGRAVGDALVEHPLVGKVGFTGSTEVGVEIARKAAGTVKRVTLELGGKSACIVFADADLEKAGRMAPFSVFENAGQDCCARSRLLVEASAKDELLEHYVATTRAIVVGDPESEATPRSVPSSRPASARRSRGTSPAASTRARPCWRAGRVPTGTGSPTASTSAPRSSTAARTTWPSPARRSSGRSSR